MVDEAVFALLEFDSVVFSSLAAFRFRHQTLTDLEILLSRYDTGEIRISSGRKLKSAQDIIEKDLFQEFKVKSSKLTDRYSKFQNYEMHS
jgi:hypothetical protein